ncbi:hypothetical protein [Streptomyces sp. enrichment culture]|uniref:hypothetical protein n=1 Tax=Streptomyces sp. enrichment culture TaxID=1795815 RepID=UPI003F571F50
MANLIYKRVSTDQQSTTRQNLVLTEAGIEDPLVFEEDAGTSSRDLTPTAIFRSDTPRGPGPQPDLPGLPCRTGREVRA